MPSRRTEDRRSGPNIKNMTIYCDNSNCAGPVAGQTGVMERPAMNYVGPKFRIFAPRRTHIYLCGCCGRRKYFKKDLAGARIYYLG